MQHEQIRIGDETKRADELVVPDISYLGVMVSKDEQELLEHAYTSATRVHMLILTRERHNSIRKRFEIDVPALSSIFQTLRKHERGELGEFMAIFQGLVSHFLPDAKVCAYTYDGRNRAGIKWKGTAWVTE